MYNKVKSEQHSAVRSAKRVAIFQASLKLVREGAGSKLSNKDNKHSNSMDETIYNEWGTVNKNDALIYR